MGHRPEGSNPCRGIRRYRRKGRERFLSDAEIGRLAATLAGHEREQPVEVAAEQRLQGPQRVEACNRLIGAVHRPTPRRIEHPGRKLLCALRRRALCLRATGDCTRSVSSDPVDSDRLPGPGVPRVEHPPLVRNPSTVGVLS